MIIEKKKKDALEAWATAVANKEDVHVVKDTGEIDENGEAILKSHTEETMELIGPEMTESVLDAALEKARKAKVK